MYRKVSMIKKISIYIRIRLLWAKPASHCSLNRGSVSEYCTYLLPLISPNCIVTCYFCPQFTMWACMLHIVVVLYTWLSSPCLDIHPWGRVPFFKCLTGHSRPGWPFFFLFFHVPFELPYQYPGLLKGLPTCYVTGCIFHSVCWLHSAGG